MSIRLHSKHGLAPALTFCRICGKDANELALLGASCDKVMRELADATDGQSGSKDGYQEYGHNRIPAREPCDECKEHLKGGVIFIADDTHEYLRLTKDMADSLVGRIGDGDRCLDIDAVRGKVCKIRKAFWYADGENIKLRDPKEWM
jgi:hypothetical protein